MIHTRHVLLALVLAVTLGILAWAAARGGEPSSRRQQLRIATWNMQWLIDPDTARGARIACREQRAALLPCDVARELARDSVDLRRLAALAQRLDADVVAFQEVENAAVAQRVFRGYDICIATGTGVQHVGFAVRRGLRFHCPAPLESISAGGRGRAGQPLRLFPPGGAPIELLAVHLKSGCARDPLDSSTDACVLLREQARALGEWIQARVLERAPFIVLGDLNRGGTPGSGDAFWSLLHPQAFEASADRLPFRNCVFGAPYREFIDHVLVSRTLLPRLHPEGFAQLRFDAAEATRYRLSDHCPVSVSLSLPGTL